MSPKFNHPIRASERITKNLLQSHSYGKVTKIPENEKQVEDITCLSRPVWRQFVDLPTELNCADLEKSLCDRLGLFSCFCCDNYREDKVYMLKSQSQTEANQKRYGCQQKLKIKIKISYSYRSQAIHTKDKSSIILHEDNIIEVSASHKPSNGLKRKMKNWQLLGEVKTCNEKVNSIISKKEELKKKYVNYYHTMAERTNQKMKEITDQIEITKTKEVRQLQATHVSQIKNLKRKQYYLVKKNNDL